jgi:hypothetical protein
MIRLLLLSFLLQYIPSGAVFPTASAGPALISHTSSAGGPTGGASPAITITGAKLLVVSVAFDSGGTGLTVTDLCANTWTPLTVAGTSGALEKGFYVINPTICANDTVTIAGVNLFASFEVAAFSGTSTLTAQAQAINTGSSSSQAVGPIATTVGNIVVSACSSGSGGLAFNSAPPLAITDQIPPVGSNHYGSGFAWGIASGTTTTATWAATTGINGGCYIATF